MKLQQFKFVREVARQGLSISAAANAMQTSQPSVSNQVQSLEDELGLQIFERYGKRLTGLTLFGESVIEMADRVLFDVENISQLAADSKNDQQGILSIGTTHTQARYVLPRVIKAFSQQYPNVHLNMVQGSPTEIAEMVATGEVDMAIATEGLAQLDTLAILPCYEWNRSIIVPSGHPLLSEEKLTLSAIAQYPILTYVMGFTGRAQQDQAFIERNLTPNVIFATTDADAIKTYVELGLGVGIIASMAFDPVNDEPLHALDVSHLFKPSTAHMGIRRGNYLRGFGYAFIEHLAPHLTRKVVEESHCLTVMQNEIHMGMFDPINRSLVLLQELSTAFKNNDESEIKTVLHLLTSHVEQIKTNTSTLQQQIMKLNKKHVATITTKL